MSTYDNNGYAEHVAEFIADDVDEIFRSIRRINAVLDEYDDDEVGDVRALDLLSELLGEEGVIPERIAQLGSDMAAVQNKVASLRLGYLSRHPKRAERGLNSAPTSAPF